MSGLPYLYLALIGWVVSLCKSTQEPACTYMVETCSFALRFCGNNICITGHLPRQRITKDKLMLLVDLIRMLATHAVSECYLI